jgi:hypothetical protein
VRGPTVRESVMFRLLIRGTERDLPSLHSVMVKRRERLVKGWVSALGRRHGTRIALSKIRNVNEWSAALRGWKTSRPTLRACGGDQKPSALSNDWAHRYCWAVDSKQVGFHNQKTGDTG